MDIEDIKALTRPVVTVIFALGFLVLTLLRIIPSEAFAAVAAAAITWWYKDRGKQ